MILIELLLGYFYAFIFGLFLLGLMFCAPLLLVSYIYKKLNQRRNAVNFMINYFVLFINFLEKNQRFTNYKI